MMKNQIKILAIVGSLRGNSSNVIVVKTIASFVPDNIDFKMYEGLGHLPLFNDSEEAPDQVVDLRNQLKSVDGVLICTPEYAFGVPGVLKNALDWVVSSEELVDKPVALITAATGGEKAHASLLLTLGALSANISAETSLLIPFIRSKINKDQVSDPEAINKLKSVLEELAKVIGKQKKADSSN